MNASPTSTLATSPLAPAPHSFTRALFGFTLTTASVIGLLLLVRL